MIVAVVDEESHMRILGVGDVDEDVLRPWTRFPIVAPVPLADAVKRKQEIVFENRRQWVSNYAYMEEDLLRTGHHATIVMPLCAGGHALGALGAAFTAPQRFDQPTVARARELAALCAAALERTAELPGARPA